MATIDISPSAGTPASTGYLIYTDAATGTFKKAPLSALPLSDAMVTALAAKQATLVSGTNIKTINGTSILGSGNISISGSGSSLGTPVAFSETIPLDIGNSYMVGDASAGPHTFVPGTSEQTGACTLYYKADGSGAPDTSAWIDRNGGITNYDDTVDMINELLFYRARSINMIAVTPIGVETVDTTPPGMVRLEAIDGTHIEAELDENVTTTGITGWSFKKNGSAFVPSGVSGGGTDTLTFTFSTSILDSDTLLASYNSGTGDTEDADSNELVSFTDSAVTNSVDSTAPTITARTATSTTTIALTFSEAVTASAATGFTTKVNGGSAIAATSISGSGSSRTLTFPASTFSGSDTITLSYALTGDVADLAGNDLAAFTDAAVTNSFATTLNAPVLTAGTPTSDGIPFTFTDTNTSPAESSGLIQITTAADTTYASIVATRTPAANATSEPAGTGLAATTNYRARMFWVGNGTTTLTSAASNQVTFTTAAAGPTELFKALFTGPDGQGLNTYTPDIGTLTTSTGPLTAWTIDTNKLECAVGFDLDFMVTQDLGVADYTLTCDMILGTTPGLGRYSYLMVRYVDANNFILIQFQADSSVAQHKYKLQKVVAGVATVIDTVDFTLNPTATLEVEVICTGTNITVNIDSVEIFNETITDFATTGKKCGFTKATGDETIVLDNFIVTD